MTKLKVTDLKKQLKNYEEKELISIILELYKLDKTVQEYLSVKFVGGDAVDELFERAEKEVKDEFFPAKGHGKLRLAVAKQAISRFKKLSKDHLKTIELMLIYVENGTKFTRTYGDIDLRFYNSMESMYDNIIMECEKSKELFDLFQDRLYAIVEDSDGIGWGYHDALENLYYSLSWLEEDE
ncbi:DUF6155 domain-containing protein [Filibacter tadaridae]|uniref:Uncharacterized protein n=1 Tax=Filibacter tadaridae TaxID=2483811 RepID=A0A3P5X1G5_9BACL|nr:DUF6155 family protein [Filibacter tadaridae]VDC28148.1 hypothetical protein FILTAD_01768 [Filibacter tadaridae]